MDLDGVIVVVLREDALQQRRVQYQVGHGPALPAGQAPAQPQGGERPARCGCQSTQWVLFIPGSVVMGRES